MPLIPEGKLSATQLKKLIFAHIKNSRQEVLRSPYVGDDCSVLDVEGDLISISADPVTGATTNLGHLGVDINLNDIAASGADPLGITVTLLCPLGTKEEEIAFVMKEMGDYCAHLHIDILGGHTEVTDAVNRMVLCVTAIGKLKREDFLHKGVLKEGDGIYMTKTAALEGTSILAAELQSELQKHLTQEELEEALSYGSLLSVIPEGRLGSKGGAAYMHDVTEGGILGALQESCDFLEMGACIEIEKIPITSVSQKVADALGIQVLRLISSGNMLLFVPSEKEEEFCSVFEGTPVLLTKIGVLTKEVSVVAKEKGQARLVERRSSDELYRALKKDRANRKKE